MDTLRQSLEYALDPSKGFVKALVTHLQMSALALLVGVLVGVPLGILISRYPRFSTLAMNGVGYLRVVPSVAVLFLLLPWLGIGFRPAVVALTLLAIPPILINTSAGLRGVDPAIMEAGSGMGMSYWQLLRRVHLPLAMPVMIAGLRIAAVEVIASAALATLIGGGGLGDFIASGLILSSNYILLVGAVPVALLSLAAELSLSTVQRRFGARVA